MPRPDLPGTLGVAFGVRDARRLGVSRSRLRAKDLARPFHGARVLVGVEAVADAEADRARTYPRSAAVARIHERAAQYAPVMAPDAFFCAVTAAALWDVPLPSRLFAWHDPSAFDPEVLDVAVPWPARAPRGRGIRGHSLRPQLVSTSVSAVSGLRLASPAMTWAMLAPVLVHPYDLVAAADHFVRARRPRPGSTQTPPVPLATIAELDAAVSAGRRIGGGRLREVLPRVRTGSDSRPESWTRLTLIDAGLPEPVLDHDVYDRGVFIGRVDMAYPAWRIAVEYEGPHHGSGAQWESDVERYARLEAAGWKVIRVTRNLLFGSPRTLVGRVRAAIDERR